MRSEPPPCVGDITSADTTTSQDDRTGVDLSFAGVLVAATMLVPTDGRSPPYDRRVLPVTLWCVADVTLADTTTTANDRSTPVLSSREVVVSATVTTPTHGKLTGARRLSDRRSTRPSV